MNYNEALEYIHKINWCFCNPGLERIEELCQRLGNPQKRLKFVHVAGTNGKGSFCAMISSILSSAGYRVGLFTSPYVKVFNERMAINGEMISNDELALLTEQIKPIADSMMDKPTEFELITAIAFEYFSRHECDIVVLECGLGGRLDSTNIIDTSVLSVITGIALDHTSILGDTIEKIAVEKAGIIKKDTPCLWCGEDIIARNVIEARAKECCAPFYTVNHGKAITKELTLDGTVFDWGEIFDLKLSLLGEYQVFNAENVLTAIEILKAQGFKITEQNVKDGLSSVIWHARFEIICKSPLIIADGGHNPQGVESAVRSIKAYFGDERLYVITGVMADKDYFYMAEQIGSACAKAYCITPDNPRALDAEKYAELYRSQGVEANAYASVEEALGEAIRDAIANKRKIICLGSLYMYCEVCDALKKQMHD